MQETEINQESYNFGQGVRLNDTHRAEQAQNQRYQSKNDNNGGLITPDPSPEAAKLFARSPLRLKYEAEVSSLKKRIGSLESIRLELGLSQRKMCQLLLVDPSAWTRWTKSGSDAPPHIYRMLQWYLAVQEKYPALDIQFWLSNLTRASEAHGWEENISKLSQSVVALNAERDRTSQALQALEARLFLVDSNISQKQNKTRPARVGSTPLLLFVALIGFMLGAAGVGIWMIASK